MYRDANLRNKAIEMIDKAVENLEDMDESDEDYTKLINDCLAVGLPLKAAEVLDSMEKPPLNGVVDLVLKECIAAGEFDKAAELIENHDSILEQISKQNVPLLRDLINGLAEADDMEKAQEIYDKITTDLSACPVEVYEAMINGYVNHKDFESAKDIFDEMRGKKMANLIHARKLRVSAELYNKMILVSTREENLPFTQDLLFDMKERGLTLPLKTLAKAFQLFNGKSEHTDAAATVRKWMDELGNSSEKAPIAPTTAQPNPEKVATKSDPFNNWIEENQLGEYRPLLEEYGFTNMRSLKYLDEAALDQMGLHQKHHLGTRLVLLAAIRKAH